ncbi:sensor histidine kinase [Actinomadura parmotrematis]|uniref:sensor histidine kinase n=1 Tax=Actinomadura parmotrematis TaxID=2864039 RepID=UPI0027E311C1|nr:HAMP domain-containing sensor histidine kinase [Actinomadura parmotrematis]
MQATQPVPAGAPGQGRRPADGGGFLSDVKALPGRVSLRLRLTVLYGLLFFMAGGLLLFVTYLLVGSILDSVFPPGYVVQTPRGDIIDPAAIKDLAMRQLVSRSLVALAGVGIIALVLGYFVADRALGSLQRVTATARRLSESTLHERIALQGPDDEIKELADTFDAMLERLGQAFDSQRRFVANASHELRTPLAINRTLLEVALGDPEVSDDLRTVGRTLLATNARHERLIEGLLLLARSERELTARVRVDVAEVATAVLEHMRRREQPHDVAVRPELASGATLGDPVLLEHLVANLVDNAIKHNDDGGEVWVRTGVLDGVTTVQVENTGPVVPAYEVDRLFEPFRRLNADRVESAKGAGLGLSIVRSVVNAHRGIVHASPRSGGGLVVTVRLPAA